MAYSLAGQKLFEPPPDVISELMSGMEVGADPDDWLAPLGGTAPLEVSEFRRTQSTPVLNYGHPLEQPPKIQQQQHQKQFNGFGPSASNPFGGSGPLPIRGIPRKTPEDYSSLESSQSLLATGATGPLSIAPGSFTDDSALLNHSYHHHHQQQQHRGLGSAPAQFGVLGSSSAPSGPPPPVIPGVGGRWQWVPDAPGSNNGPPMATAPDCFQQQQQQRHPHHHDMFNQQPFGSVDIASGPIPLPMSNGPLPLPMSMGEMDLDLDLLDNINVLEMADALAPMPPSRPSIRHRVAGSCPLPALLEDTLSAEDGRSGGSSDDTMAMRANTSSPSIDVNDSGIFDLERAASGSFNVGSLGGGGSRHGHGHGHSIPRGVPIAGARGPVLKRSSSRSLSSPHLASNLLASSLPAGNQMATDRPVRSAARRSMALAAALQDGSDSEPEDGSEGVGMRPSSFTHGSAGTGGGSLRRVVSTGRINSFGSGGAGSGGGHGSNKKKHNPWSLEETLALVEGVRLAGVGKWAEIKRLPVPAVASVLEHRSPVDLKDKWRNLTRVARLPKATLKARLGRAHSDVPLDTMLHVKQLMEAGMDGE